MWEEKHLLQYSCRLLLIIMFNKRTNGWCNSTTTFQILKQLICCCTIIFRLKLSIESFLTSHCTNEQYDVAIFPQTTIKDLKQIVWINKWNIHDSFTITDDSTYQRETKRQKAREKYASMREIYQQKKAEKEAARNNIENIGIIFFQNWPMCESANSNAFTLCRCCPCD